MCCSAHSHSSTATKIQVAASETVAATANSAIDLDQEVTPKGSCFIAVVIPARIRGLVFFIAGTGVLFTFATVF
jgi:hypothetical protein